MSTPERERGAGSMRENLRRWGRKAIDAKCETVLNCLNNVIRKIRF